MLFAPCCGGASQNYESAEWQVEEYMGARPRSRQDALKPFLAEEGEGGAPAQSDSGGASFLGQVALPHASGNP